MLYHRVIPVSVKKNTPPDNNTNTGGKISFENSKSGAGLQFLLLGGMAKPRGERNVFVHRHRYPCICLGLHGEVGNGAECQRRADKITSPEVGGQRAGRMSKFVYTISTCVLD